VSGYHRRVLKLLLISILLATYVLPVYAARIRDPRRAFRSILAAMGLAYIGYAFVLYVIYPRFS
jgi:hypothetical protein